MLLLQSLIDGTIKGMFIIYQCTQYTIQLSTL